MDKTMLVVGLIGFIFTLGAGIQAIKQGRRTVGILYFIASISFLVASVLRIYNI